MVWPSDWANFVIAMRQFGPSNALNSLMNTAPNTPAPSSLTGASATIPTAIASSLAAIVQDWAPDFGKAATFTFRSPLDLIGATVEISPAGLSNGAIMQAGQPFASNQILRNPFSSDLSEVRNYLGRLLDAVTIDLSPIAEGRVDVSDAPAEVLAGVPGLDFILAQRIVQQRSTSSNATATQQIDTIAWLLEVVDLNSLKELEPYLTCRSDVYSVQAVGYRDSQSAVYRITATIDARQNPIQLRDQKVWHPWDRGFPIEQLTDQKP